MTTTEGCQQGPVFDPQPGDRIYLQYGCMAGDAYATVTRSVSDRWGLRWDLQLDDGSFDSVSRIDSVLLEREGIVRGCHVIGAYLVATEQGA